MSKYAELKFNPPVLEIEGKPKEVIFTTISCMCDNVHTIRMKKDSEGEFKMSGMGFALSNWQMKHKPFEIEWEADAGRWDCVINMINSGTEKIEKLIYR